MSDAEQQGLSPEQLAEIETPSQTPEEAAPNPQPEIKETVLDPSFFDGDFEKRFRNVRLLETEAFRRKKGTLPENETIIVKAFSPSADNYFKSKEEGIKHDEWAKIRDVYIQRTQSSMPPHLKKAFEQAEAQVGKETIFRLELILRCCRSDMGQPVFTRQQVLVMAEYFSNDFMDISNAILDLNGEGPNAGE